MQVLTWGKSAIDSRACGSDPEQRRHRRALRPPGKAKTCENEQAAAVDGPPSGGIRLPPKPLAGSRRICQPRWHRHGGPTPTEGPPSEGPQRRGEPWDADRAADVGVALAEKAARRQARSASKWDLRTIINDGFRLGSASSAPLPKLRTRFSALRTTQTRAVRLKLTVHIAGRSAIRKGRENRTRDRLVPCQIG